MSEERMPKGLAAYILSIVSLFALGTWATFNGHEDAVMAGLGVFLGILAFIAVCGLVFFVFEAIRSLLGL